MTPDQLAATARARGVATTYQDVRGGRHEASPDTLQALLAALGAPPDPDPAWPAVVVARTGQKPAWVPPAGATVVLESGEERPLPEALPGELPLGWHRVVGRGGQTVLVVAPAACHLPRRLAAGGRSWGWAAQLYALRSTGSWGVGDLGDLARLLGPDGLDPGFVLVNPLHAAPPTQPSPYFPSSRVFRNPLYLRVEAVPELRALDPDGRALLAGLTAAGRRLSSADRLDRVAAGRLKDEALRRCHQALERLPARRAALAAHRAATPGLDDFATFCALQHAHGPDWRRWPAALRRPGAPAVAAFRAEHAAEADYHAYLQWLLDEQLAALPRGEVGLVNDLAVGFAPDGFDAWRFQGELAAGVTVGAPPDPLGPHGQDWGVPPFVPGRLAAAGYAPFAQTIRAGMAHAGGLRIDHVMGLFRLFWIPAGGTPADGTYVRYPVDDLLGVLALESARAAALVIGEDLGTVAPGVRERLAAERVLSYRLAWFERDTSGTRRPAAAWPRLALAAATTHDLPTVAGFFSGADLAHLRDIGRLPAAGHQAAAADQARERDSLLRLLEAEGVLAPGARDLDTLVAAVHAFLARTPSMLVAATLEDAVGATDRPNVPGTVDERPNWSLPLPVPLDGLADDPGVRRLAAVLGTVSIHQREPREALDGTS